MTKNTMLLALFGLLTAFFGCGGNDNNSDGTDPAAVFTDPNGTSENKATLLRYIRGAEKTLDVEQFLMEDRDLAQALVDAKNDGIAVRVVGDNETATESGTYWNLLTAAGITVVFDASSYYAHNKTVIVDSTTVLAGSTNWTYSCLNQNNNDLIILPSRDLALLYLQDFSEMFAGRFHSAKRGYGPDSVILDDGASVEIRFGPVDHPLNQILANLSHARNTVDIGIYALTNQSISDTLKALKRRGVTVRMIMDSLTVVNYTSEYSELRNSGIDVRLDPCPWAFHSKYAIIDRGGSSPGLLVSSGNWSSGSLNYYDENFLAIKGGVLPGKFAADFEKWWAQTTASSLK